MIAAHSWRGLAVAAERKPLNRWRAVGRLRLTPAPGAYTASRSRHCAFEVDRDELRDAALRHGDAVEPVHARHGNRIVR